MMLSDNNRKSANDVTFRRVKILAVDTEKKLAHGRDGKGGIIYIDLTVYIGGRENIVSANEDWFIQKLAPQQWILHSRIGGFSS